MASFSAGVSVKLGAGGFIFFISDMMIGVNIAKMGVPYGKEIVIVTYLLS